MLQFLCTIAFALMFQIEAKDSYDINTSDCIRYGNSCFIFDPNEEMLTFSAAEEKCIINGGNLALVKNQAILETLGDKIRSKVGVWSPWIGLHLDTNGTWSHLDQSPLNISGFHPWADEHPRAEHDCARLYTFENKLYSEKCSLTFSYICQYYVNSNTSDVTIDYDDYEASMYAEEEDDDDDTAEAAFFADASHDEDDEGKDDNDDDSFEQSTETEDEKIDNESFQGRRLPPSNVVVKNFTILFPGIETSTSAIEETVECEKRQMTCSIPTFSDKEIIITKPHSSYEIGESIIVVCNDGYFIQGSHPKSHLEMRCRGFDEWDPQILSIRCYQNNQFEHTQHSMETKTERCIVQQNVKLSCKISPSSLNVTPVSWLWTKNQIPIENTTLKDSYTLKSNGVLSFLFTKEHEGIYLCFALYTNTLEPGLLAYTVTENTFNESVYSSEDITSVTVHEGLFTRLVCLEYEGKKTRSPPIWYMNGSRIWDDNTFRLLADGALLIRYVRLIDDGLYTCTYNEVDNICSVNRTTYVRVIPVAKSTCGKGMNANGIPWLVSLWWENEASPFCYGSVLNKEWIITLGTCLYGPHIKNNPKIGVRVNQNQNSTEIYDDFTLIQTEIAILHHNYSRIHNTGEIGLLKLKAPLNFSSTLMPVCISESFEEYFKHRRSCDESVHGETVGYGSLRSIGSTVGTSPVVVHNLEMDGKYPTRLQAESLLVAASLEDVNTPFPADTGAPLFITWDGRRYLYGIFNWGEIGIDGMRYSYFTKVTNYVEWIKTVVGNNIG